tara:strand:+ start:2394 stop:2759 length:366 start_codon:yes stop_codon:yes gene_type:complete
MNPLPALMKLIGSLSSVERKALEKALLGGSRKHGTQGSARLGRKFLNDVELRPKRLKSQRSSYKHSSPSSKEAKELRDEYLNPPGSNRPVYDDAWGKEAAKEGYLKRMIRELIETDEFGDF